MPAYTLGFRQSKAYNGTFNLWKPNPAVTDSNARVIESQSYPTTPTYASVKGRMMPKSESSIRSPWGRSNRDIIITTDILRIHQDQEIDDGWLVQMVTPDHPEINTYFTIQGGTTTFDWRAKSRTLMIKRVIKPVFKD